MMAEKRRQAVRLGVATVIVTAVAIALQSRHEEHRMQQEAVRARAVVRQQLDAFRRGDYRAAFTCAAAGFHQRMSVTQFRKMVEEGFPQIAHPSEYHLGPTQWANGMALVDVVVTGRSGVISPHRYLLTREPEGWKVQGVSGGLPPQPPGDKGRPEPPLPPGVGAL